MQKQNLHCVNPDCKERHFSKVAYCPYCGKPQDIKLTPKEVPDENNEFKFLPSESDKYLLTYEAGENGSIQGHSRQSVNKGSNGTTVTAIPSEGYHFEKWSDGITTASRTDKGVKGNVHVTAKFAPNLYTLEYKADGKGSIKGESHQTLNQGENGSIVRAIPSDGYQFEKWSDGSTDNPRSESNVRKDIQVSAIFKKINEDIQNAIPTKKGPSFVKILPVVVLLIVFVAVGAAMYNFFFDRDPDTEALTADVEITAQDALRNGVNISILTNELNRAHILLERAQRLADISSRYQEHVNRLEEPIPGLVARLNRQIQEYQVNIAKLGDSGKGNIDNILDHGREGFSNREQAVLELIARHVNDYKESQLINPESLRESFQIKFKEFED
jgi:hypothetical protein